MKLSEENEFLMHGQHRERKAEVTDSHTFFCHNKIRVWNNLVIAILLGLFMTVTTYLPTLQNPF